VANGLVTTSPGTALADISNASLNLISTAFSTAAMNLISAGLPRPLPAASLPKDFAWACFDMVVLNEHKTNPKCKGEANLRQRPELRPVVPKIGGTSDCEIADLEMNLSAGLHLARASRFKRQVVKGKHGCWHVEYQATKTCRENADDDHTFFLANFPIDKIHL
jgi:hypothetical protein